MQTEKNKQSQAEVLTTLLSEECRTVEDVH